MKGCGKDEVWGNSEKRQLVGNRKDHLVKGEPPSMIGMEGYVCAVSVRGLVEC